MEGANQSDDFDDFFDIPGRSAGDDIPSKDSQTGMKTPFTSENDDKQDRKSVSSETDEDVSESDSYSDTDNIVNKTKYSSTRSLSESKSSRSESGSSVNSESPRQRRPSKQSVKERHDSSSSENTYSRDSRSDRSPRTEGRDFKKSETEERNESLSSSSSRGSRSGKYSERARRGFSPQGKQLMSRSPTYGRNDGKKPNRRSDTSSSETESSFSDDSENSSRKTSSYGKEVSDIKHQAWVTDGGDSSSSALRHTHERPKTEKRVSSKVDSFQHKRLEDERQSPSSNSDSDMTDVSPMTSPRNGSLNGHGSENTSCNAYNKEPKSVHDKKYRAMPLHEDGPATENYADRGNSIDLKILMEAVSELEKEKRVKAQTRRVMFEPVQQKPYEKSNYTFSNDDTDRIERENKRLLEEIMRCMHGKSERRQPKMVDPFIKQSTLTASAINRRRDQKRIENENLAFLKRLQSIKPSKGISKAEQLHAYNSTVLHGIPISALHPMPSGKPQHSGHSSSSSIMGSISYRARSHGSLWSNASPSVSSVSSRQSSRASSRPTSAKMGERPPWNERW